MATHESDISDESSSSESESIDNLPFELDSDIMDYYLIMDMDLTLDLAKLIASEFSQESTLIRDSLLGLKRLAEDF